MDFNPRNPRRIVGILPGSRNHEVTRNWPLMLEVMQHVHQRHPNVRFLVACYKDSHREFCERSFAPRSQALLGNAPHNAEPPALPAHFFVGKTPEIIETAECCLMVSGSVSLEMLARTTPAVVLYRFPRWAYYLVRPLLRVKSITLPNLIAGRTLLPEFVVAWRRRRDIQTMSDILNNWLADGDQLRRAQSQLIELRNQIARTGASARAADAILHRLPAPTAAKRAA